MDAIYIDQSVEDSRQCRSRSSSHLSSTAAQFQDLNISTSDFPDQGSHPSPKTALTAPVPQQHTPFPLLSDSDLDANWSRLSATEDHSGSAPLLRLDPVQLFPEDHQYFGDQRSLRSSSNPTTMSAIGVQQFDSRFDASMHSGLRHTYTWPQIDINDQFVHQPNISSEQLTPSSLYDEPKLLPMFSRSLSSSPPRPNLTVEQRELKRQRDHARRDSKTQMRRERSASNTSNHSNPYITSQHGSPDMIPRTLPEYTSNLTPSPLLSQGSSQNSPALRSSSFLAPYSPPLNDHAASDMYGPVYSMGPNDFTSNPAFPMPFSNTGGEPGLQALVGRPQSMSLSSATDASSQYLSQVSPSMGLTESGDHVRVVHSRPKPQCWEHGCDGRQFSTFSNLLRHQREKSGAAQKSSCPNCGAEFTRTTARNGHMAHDKCKARRN
ncbi:uncharacterized protein RAG0_01951 [Rhynchosporium agropyri]|uniref:C2H2-type domain-containing protein n=1 Tax=Rhynchosporium agropyri TaxID=914238 RepID=A0A1E1JZD7_9HELO|nr:uncharacterized protein RAG0_01951 [Rhynchosporium agropyri]